MFGHPLAAPLLWDSGMAHPTTVSTRSARWRLRQPNWDDSRDPAIFQPLTCFPTRANLRDGHLPAPPPSRLSTVFPHGSHHQELRVFSIKTTTCVPGVRVVHMLLRTNG